MQARSLWTVVLIVNLALGLSCAQFSAGKTYTLAKVDRETFLVDPSLQLGEDPTSPDHWDDPVGGTIEIRLADHFIKYLTTLGRPEVVIFSRVVVRDPSRSERGIVFERVLQNTEDPNAYTAANQGAGNSARGIVLLPSMKYAQEEISISLRIVELDQADNERLENLLHAAAAGAAQFYPEGASAISLTQAVLSFVIANNPDDLEFAIDIGLSPSSGRYANDRLRAQVEDSQLSSGAADAPIIINGRRDVTLQPRIGHLAIIKTELQQRPAYKSDLIGVAAEGIRWSLMNALKLATLDALNWASEDKEFDAYSRLFGQPLRVPTEGLREPAPDEQGRISHVDLSTVNTAWSLARWNGFDQGGNLKPLAYRHGQLVVIDDDADAAQKVRWFSDKSYLVLTIDSPMKGLPVSELPKLADDISELKIRTTQLSPAEFRLELSRVTCAVTKLATVRNAKAEANSSIADAPDAASAESIRQRVISDVLTSLKAKQDECKYSDSDLRAVQRELEIVTGKDIRRREEDAAARNCGVRLAAQRFAFAEPPAELKTLLLHPGNAGFSGGLVEKTQAGQFKVEVAEIQNVPTRSTLTLQAVNGKFGHGDYELFLSWTGASKPATCERDNLEYQIIVEKPTETEQAGGHSGRPVRLVNVESRLMLRDKPKEGTVVAGLDPETRVELLDSEKDGWVKVEVASGDHKGKQGYVSAKFLKEVAST